MKYTPPLVATGDLVIARNPTLGAEKKLYASDEPAEEVGEFAFVATGSGTWTPDPVTVLPTAGSDLQLVVDEQLSAGGVVTLWVDGTDAADQAMTGSGTFAPPRYVQNQKPSFQHGMAVDVQAAGKFKTVTNVRCGATGNRQSRVKVYKLPTEWALVGCVDSVEPQVGIRPAVSIPCGAKGTAFVVAGRSQESTIAVRAKHFSVADGLNRFAGRNCSIKLDVVKSGAIHVETHVFGNCVLAVNPNFPDGDEVVADAANGSFQVYAGFPAP